MSVVSLTNDDLFAVSLTQKNLSATRLTREDLCAIKAPDPLPDPVVRSDHFLQETSGADQLNLPSVSQAKVCLPSVSQKICVSLTAISLTKGTPLSVTTASVCRQ